MLCFFFHLPTNKRHLSPGSKGFESGFPNEWGRVFVHLSYNLNVIIYLPKKDILNEWIVICEIFSAPSKEDINRRENGISTMTANPSDII